MKRIIVLALALCVVAPASFAATNYEYNWVGTTGNFADSANWSCTTSPQPSPAVPFEDGMGGGITTTADYSRPIINKAGAVVTVNTDLMPANKGFRQVQIGNGSVVEIASGGKMMVNQYLYCSASVASSGLIVKSGGTYVNTKGVGSQNGHMFGYRTAGEVAFTTLEAGSTFTANAVYLNRAGYSVGTTGNWNIIGSGSAINITTLLFGGNHASDRLNYNFTSDAGGISTVNVATSIEFANTAGGKSYLDLVFGPGAAPAASYTLFNLAEGATSSGKLVRKDGTTIGEGTHVRTQYQGVGYYYQASYVGGTGNDITLTLVPEPATLGLLSLGGLAMLRRRRA